MNGVVMADNKRKRGKADRSKVARLQRYEIAYIAKKFGVSLDTVRRIIRSVGHSRRKIYATLRSPSRLIS